jgi:hypothetical protein
MSLLHWHLEKLMEQQFMIFVTDPLPEGLKKGCLVVQGADAGCRWFYLGLF